jgi:ATP synthase protein I
VKTDNQKNSLKKQQKPLNNYLKYTGLAFQFLAAILLGFWLGSWLDNHYQTEKPWYTMALTMGFLIATLYKVIRDIIHE